ncbi:MAG: GatB/YqeY domain-containing protein [Mariprofundus sp.]|nr:GatB/YqeY domain-containing protein [Mariprofundus sp.]
MLKQLTEDMKTAMKAGDKQKLSCIRMLRAAIKDKEIELGRGLDETEAMAVLAKLVKQRIDAASQYADAGRDDLKDKELAEVEIIQAYLPEPLSGDELDAMVDQAISQTGATGMRDMGKVMAIVKDRAAGRADMGKLSGIVKARLA